MSTNEPSAAGTASPAAPAYFWRPHTQTDIVGCASHGNGLPTPDDYTTYNKYEPHNGRCLFYQTGLKYAFCRPRTEVEKQPKTNPSTTDTKDPSDCPGLPSLKELQDMLDGSSIDDQIADWLRAVKTEDFPAETTAGIWLRRHLWQLLSGKPACTET